jgi:hypothetical protein
VPVRPKQYRRHVKLFADVGDVVDPVGPAVHRKPPRLVEQQPAAGAHQLEQAPMLELDVA